MALFTTPIIIFSFLFSPFFDISTDAKFSEQFAEATTNSPHRTAEKTTHLHFYFHDIVSGPHPTAVTVAGTKNKFGATAVIDDPLTENPDPGSKVVGRAQGIYATSSKDTVSLLMVLNFVFVEGVYNGSALSVLGRNRFLEPVRELPVLGGTGIFRFARGYALAKTVTFDVGTGDAVVEYNVFVLHH
ncbi:hypothetical protein ABFS82_04G077600 [Erythranthe guttata]|uniref:Dirigent protein n=1 Tax=Erythranthe guttata TaxID=4155 RepID=A0A022RZV7_ERYGU|nr:PREDICTED: dirigent protein 1-like [Erythranthe guttata]EYU46052.1 hypothetical protein MIMGU_mgv1a024219mg [Erythranthe guttata]|eukprot:XP_012836676.1 PREDICTED: dirigent protein 1-like [Erythranthe guttata]